MLQLDTDYQLKDDCVCCRSMNSKMVSQEEQITEYTDRIAAMEEELKRVRLSNFCFCLSDGQRFQFRS